ncbi:MAG: winged helix-turn-helix transcriptional regulator [Alphaproteobacteria bacterium]
MLEYGQFCPVAKTAEILGEKWTLLILRELLLGATRFNQIQRAMSKISPTVLNKRLATLQQRGLIVRTRVSEQKVFEYQLTECGRELFPLVVKMAEWGMRWARSTMRDEELDVELLMTDIQRRIDPAKLPRGQTVIKFKFTDLKNYANWWIKIVDEDVDLCTDNPGYDVDVFFTTELRTMTEVWMGDISLQKAQDDRRLMVNVLSPHLRNLKSWFPLYRLANIRPARHKEHFHSIRSE